ncbi:MAG: MG2 domain-containing protein, partial [Parvularcula sp.]|nr:MG2 domain-containing protein [Parvularcula sp.]
MKFLLQCAFALAALGLVSCERSEEAEAPQQLETVAEGERMAVPQQDREPGDRAAPFAYQRLVVDDSGERPLLCLHFTEALDTGRDYEPFIGIDRRVAVTAEGQRLCLAGLSYGEETKLTLRAGLPSADGDTLAADESVRLTFQDRPPMVGFAGNGVILPIEGAEGLGITTINVDAVEVKISRVDERALAFRRVTEGMTAAEGEYAWNPYDEDPGELGSPVFEGRLTTEGPLNALQTTLLPIREAVGNLEAGAYFVEIADLDAEERGEDRPARAARWLLVTDLAPVVYRGSTGLDVTVRNIGSARPVGGVEVELISQGNEVLARQKTGRDGRVHFDAPLLAGRNADRPKLITANKRGDGFALLDLDRAPLDLSGQNVGGAEERDGSMAFLYLDRGIYRPGETVHLTGLIRDAEGYAADDLAGTLILTRPNGLEQNRWRFDGLEDAGALQRSFALPEAAMRGMWTASVELDGQGEAGSVRFNVEDFVPQRLALELSAEDSPIGIGETRMIEARARFLYGAPGAGLSVDGTARIETDPRPFPEFSSFSFGIEDDPYRQELIELPEVITDGEGVATLPLAPGRRGAEASAPLRLRAVIRVQEPGGRAVQDDLRIPYRPRDEYLGIALKTAETAPARKAVPFEMVLLGRDGAPAEGEARWQLDRRDFDYDWYEDENGRWRWRRSERRVPVAEGEVVFEGDGAVQGELLPLDWGEYRLTAYQDGVARAAKSFWIGYGGRSADGTPAPDSVRVLLPEAGARLGEEVTVAIDPPYAGLAEVAVATGKIISLQHIEVPAEGTEITFTPDEEWGPGAYILVSLYTDREPSQRPVPRRAVGAAYLGVDVSERTFAVEIEAPDIARPDERLAVTLRHSGGPEGEPVFATLAAVDEGILMLTKFESPDPVEALFGKARLGVEIYDDYGRILDPNSGEMSALREGGDQIGGAGLTVVPTRTVALFEGPLRLDEDGSTTIELDLPPFNGELRLMPVVWSRSGVGAASEPLTVREPVPAELSLPRFLAPGDRAVATLSLHNIEGPEGSYSFRVRSDDVILEVSAEAAGELELASGQRKEAQVLLSAVGTGVTEVQLSVEGPGGYSDQRSYPLQIRGPFLPERRITERSLASG